MSWLLCSVGRRVHRLAATCSLIALTTIAIVSLGGCSANDGVSSVPSHAPRLRPTQAADASLDTLAAAPAKSNPQSNAPANPPANPKIESLVQQSERDVQAILKAKAELDRKKALQASTGYAPDDELPSAKPDAITFNGTAGGSTALNSNPAAPPATGPKAIIWNESPHRPATPPAASATPHGSSSATAANLKTPEPEFRQSPLFRDPVETLEPAAKNPTAPSPSSSASLEPDKVQKLMIDLSRELYANGAYSDVPLKQLIVISAMSVVDPSRSLDPQAIPDLTEKERDLLGKMQTFFAQIGKTLDGKADTEQSIIDAVNTLRLALVKQAQLKLATATLCTRVGGFGDFSEFTKTSPEGGKTAPVFSFLAHSDQKVIVYLEIADFMSVVNEKSEFVTELSQQLTIYSERDGIPVWKEDWQAAVDVTKNKRQDFFTVQVITLPKALSVGKYQLKVRVRDEKSQAETEGSIPFEMVADPKMVSMAR